MANPKNFPAEFLTKSASSSRSISDPIEEVTEEPELPTPQEMIDALYNILMERLDRIEEKLEWLKK